MIRRLRRVPRPLALLLAVATIEALAWIVLIPAFQGPDENSHFTYTQRIVERGEIPWRLKKGSAPPVYPHSDEVRVAMDVAGLGPLAANLGARPAWTAVDQRRWAAADRGLGAGARTGGGYTPALRNPPLYYLYEAAPYAVAHGGSIFDRAYLMRLWNIPALWAVLVFTWLLACELLPGPLWPRFLATGAVASVPQLTNVTATIDPDILLSAEMSAALWLMVLIVRRGPLPRLLWPLAALCVAAPLTHPRLLPILVPAALAVVLALRRQGRLRRSGWMAAGIWAGFVLAVLVLAGWRLGVTREFLSYLWQFYLPKLPSMKLTVGPPAYDFPEVFIDRFYGTLAQLEVVLPHGLRQVLLWASAAGLAALIATLVVKRRALARNGAEAFVLGSAFVALMLGLHIAAYRAMVTNPADPIVTGRYLLPLVPLFGIAIAIVARSLPRAIGPAFAGAVLATGFGLQMVSLGLLLERFYA